MRQSNRYNPPWERDTGANYMQSGTGVKSIFMSILTTCALISNGKM